MLYPQLCEKRVINVNFMTGGGVNENSPEDEVGGSSGLKPVLSCFQLPLGAGLVREV